MRLLLQVLTTAGQFLGKEKKKDYKNKPDVILLLFCKEFLCCYLLEHAWKTHVGLPAYLMSASVISTTFFLIV